MMLTLLASVLARQHAADMSAVSPKVLPMAGGGTLALTGDGHGGLLAGSAWAGHAAPPANMTLCCDYNGLSTAIGGETRATMQSATSGSCPVPPFGAAGTATVELFLTAEATCDKGAEKQCHLGGSPRHCDGGLTGKPEVEVKTPASILSFAVGRRPYVHETSGALVVRAETLAGLRGALAAGLAK
jgi:hypothetical protein